MIQVQAGSALRKAASLRFFQAGVLLRARSVQFFQNGELHTGFSSRPAMTAALSPTEILTNTQSSSATSAACRAEAFGGQGPFSYAWTPEAVDGAISALTPQMAQTQFRADGLIPNEPVSAIFRVTITDSLGQSSAATVSLSFTRVGQSGGIIE